MDTSWGDEYAGVEADAMARRERDGRAAMDRCIEDYLKLELGDSRRTHLTRVISLLSFPEDVRKAG